VNDLLTISLLVLFLCISIKLQIWVDKRHEKDLEEEQEEGFTTTVGGDTHLQEYNLYDKGDQ